MTIDDMVRAIVRAELIAALEERERATEWLDVTCEVDPLIGRQRRREAVASGDLAVARVGRKLWCRRSDLDAYVAAHMVQPGEVETDQPDEDEEHIARLMRRRRSA